MTHKTPFSKRLSVEKPSPLTAPRQLPVPKVLQRKMSNESQAPGKRTAPPAYRPQPVPKVLQRKMPVVLQQNRTIDITPVPRSTAVIQRSRKERWKEGKQEATITIGKITLSQEFYHRTVKPTIMGKINPGELLGRKGAHNVDIYFDRDGSILISENGMGGKKGVDTELNLFDLFPALRPAEAEVAPQQRNLDLTPMDSDDEGH